MNAIETLRRRGPVKSSALGAWLKKKAVRAISVVWERIFRSIYPGTPGDPEKTLPERTTIPALLYNPRTHRWGPSDL